MNKKIFISAIIFLAVSIIGIIILASNTKTSQRITKTVDNISQIVLFYGDGCPHCALVEKFIAENNIQTKVQFTKKEVYYNKQNADDLAGKARLCGMPTDSIGVPFLWDGKICFVGDQPIIDFLKRKSDE